MYPWISYRELEQVYQTRETVFYHILNAKKRPEESLKTTRIAACVCQVRQTSVRRRFSIFRLIINFYSFKLDKVLKVDRYILLIDFWESINYTVFQWWWGILYVEFLFLTTLITAITVDGFLALHYHMRYAISVTECCG